MKYFLIYLMVWSIYLMPQEAAVKRWRSVSNVHTAYSKTLIIPQVSESEKKERQTQLNHVGFQLIKDLLNVVNPEKIEEQLQQWDLLKTDELNILTPDIDRIIATALTAHELARVAAHSQAQDSGLRSSSKVQFAANSTDTHALEIKYINAQLNCRKICNYLGIKHETIFITGSCRP